MLMDAVFARTGVTATAGIGTNLFLAKVALDVTAKHAPDNIGVLDEERFRDEVWCHRPITDIWNIGRALRGGWRATACSTCAASLRWIAMCSMTSSVRTPST